ncbi:MULTISPECIES: hypothetical protein [Bacillus cereus group]|uniref:TrbC/VIRB2 family protein n=1 Tax=Bacillus cereus 03BB108 TaxID=451709 RepID=A0AAN0W4W2_BACCE|nr:hypothetical protein [Bacillus cereus]AJI08757.1 hypothetical protein AK40_5544 [Bacillus cereus 03BB108]EDX60079.1 conserved hypothetical protein [Bacillus cereus 03BB108]QKG99034.1 hypothetical protein FOC96_01935 [Bacillus cereus]HDR7252878.1 hypothetical protein [Bacillus pacificus]
MTLVTQTFKRVILTITMLAALFAVGQNTFTNSPVLEAGSNVFSGVDAGGQKVTVQNNAKSGIFKDMNGLLIIAMGLAGFVVIFALIFAGVKLATAQGNPQNRTQAFIGLGVACVGGWVVYKCLVIAGWVGGFGG